MQLREYKTITTPFQDYLDVSCKIKKGDSFNITHVDGFVAKETVSHVKYDGYINFYVICESACVYLASEIERDGQNIKLNN